VILKIEGTWQNYTMSSDTSTVTFTPSAPTGNSTTFTVNGGTNPTLARIKVYDANGNRQATLRVAVKAPVSQTLNLYPVTEATETQLVGNAPNATSVATELQNTLGVYVNESFSVNAMPGISVHYDLNKNGGLDYLGKSQPLLNQPEPASLINSLTGVQENISATESGTTVTLTLASGNWPSSYMSSAVIFVSSCSVPGYNSVNGPVTITGGGSGGTTLTFTDTISGLANATGCTVSLNTNQAALNAFFVSSIIDAPGAVPAGEDTLGFASTPGSYAFVQNQTPSGQPYTTAHETGHMLGLDHNTSDSKALMTPLDKGNSPCRLHVTEWNKLNRTGDDSQPAQWELAPPQPQDN
jgi:hypothetical protein